MVANNFIEIYTLTFAWDLYKGIWDVLTGTGLALLPILFVILNIGKHSFENESVESVAKLEVSIISMLLVLFFCVIPFGGFSHSFSSIQYSLDAPDCQLRAASEDQKKGTGHPQSGLYASTFSEMSNQTVYRPILWVLVQKVSSALTFSTIASMECVNNYTAMIAKVSEYKINDLELLEEISEFTESCYLKGMRLYKQNPITLPSNTPELNKLDWIGSRTLLNTDNDYYKHSEAYMKSMERRGFTRNELWRSSDKEQPGGANPYCYEVWEGEELGTAEGLRDKIYNSIDEGGVENIVSQWESWGSEVFSVGEMSSEDKKDMLIKLVLRSQNVDPISSFSLTGMPIKKHKDIVRANQQIKDNKSEWFVGTVVSIMDNISLAGAKYKVRVLGPIILALLQLIVIFCSPIFMVYSGYKIKTFGVLVFTYFSLEFIHAIWAAAFWFEEKLLDLYVSSTHGAGFIWGGTLIDNLGVAILILMPTVWLMMCAKYGASAIQTVATTGEAPTGSSGRFINTVASFATRGLSKAVSTKVK